MTGAVACPPGFPPLSCRPVVRSRPLKREGKMAELGSKGVTAGKIASNVQKKLTRAQEKVGESVWGCAAAASSGCGDAGAGHDTLPQSWDAPEGLAAAFSACGFRAPLHPENAQFRSCEPCGFALRLHAQDNQKHGIGFGGERGVGWSAARLF